MSSRSVEQRIARGCDDAMFLLQPLDSQVQPRIVLHEPCKRLVLARVMEAVGKVVQVVNDVTHQLIIGALAGVKNRHLGIEIVEQLRETVMLGMPYGDRIDHEGLHKQPAHKALEQSRLFASAVRARLTCIKFVIDFRQGAIGMRRQNA
jgi:hypothetical protein